MLDPEEQSVELSSSLWSCRKRAICPLSSDVFSTSPSEPAVSKSSRWSFVGIVFHCMMTAAPRQRRICSSISATVFPVEGFSRGFVLRVEVSRTDYFVEIVRQPGLVLREFGEASLRTLQFTDFARNIGVFECFGAFRRFFSKLFGCEHETLLCDTEGGLPLNGAVTPAYWMLVTVYGDDQDELRRLFSRFPRLPRLYLKSFRKEPAQAPYSGKPPPTPCGDRNSSPHSGESRSEKVAQTG